MNKGLTFVASLILIAGLSACNSNSVPAPEEPLVPAEAAPGMALTGDPVIDCQATAQAVSADFAADEASAEQTYGLIPEVKTIVKAQQSLAKLADGWVGPHDSDHHDHDGEGHDAHSFIGTCVSSLRKAGASAAKAGTGLQDTYGFNYQSSHLFTDQNILESVAGEAEGGF